MNLTPLPVLTLVPWFVVGGISGRTHPNGNLSLRANLETIAEIPKILRGRVPDVLEIRGEVYLSQA